MGHTHVTSAFVRLKQEECKPGIYVMTLQGWWGGGTRGTWGVVLLENTSLSFYSVLSSQWLFLWPEGQYHHVTLKYIYYFI